MTILTAKTLKFLDKNRKILYNSTSDEEIFSSSKSIKKVEAKEMTQNVHSIQQSQLNTPVLSNGLVISGQPYIFNGCGGANLG